MQQAFLVLAHKNPRQLTKLVDYLAKDNFVLVHIDVKSVSGFGEFIQKHKESERVKIYSEYKVYWGSYNQIQATFLLLREALQHFKFDYVSLISGQDVPIKSTKEFGDFLAKNNNRDFLSVKELSPNNGWDEAGGLNRIRLHWITDFDPKYAFFYAKLNVAVHFIQHLFKTYRGVNTKLYGGDNWFVLSHETAVFVNEFLKSKPAFLSRFKNTRCADEIILATVLMNSTLRSKIENTSLRFIDWHNGPEFPRTFREADFERLKNSGNAFLARKFDENVDSKIIDRIYSELLNAG